MWDAATRAARASGELAVIGVVQEQHPARAQLFAQWQELDWPILWDPFNTLGDAVVPVYRLIDEYGVVRQARPRPEDLESFLSTTFEPPPGEDSAAPGDPGQRRTLAPLASAATAAHGPNVLEALSAMTFGRSSPDRSLMQPLVLAALNRGEPLDHFRLGVATRMRHDSPLREPEDFARALEQWGLALAGEPGQYIWRRRIQQYGPRLDKPYPFYDWVDRARAEIRARGEEPVALPVPLTGSELAAADTVERGGDGVEPDPEGAVPRDTEGLFRVGSALAIDTGENARVARLHLWITPEPGVHWNNEAEGAVVWLDATSLPAGWELERGRTDLPAGPEAVSIESRGFDLELRAPEGFAGSVRLAGYLCTDACRDDFVCFRLRRDFEVELAWPAR